MMPRSNGGLVTRAGTLAAAVLLAGFAVASAPHLVHHLGEHQDLTAGCAVLLVLQSVQGLPGSPSEVFVFVTSALLLLPGASSVHAPTPLLSYFLRAPPPSPV